MSLANMVNASCEKYVFWMNVYDTWITACWVSWENFKAMNREYFAGENSHRKVTGRITKSIYETPRLEATIS